MKTIKTNLAVTVVLAAAGGFFPACSCDGDDDGAAPDASDIDAPGADADINAFPTLGTQIDRTGRPAVSTALIKSFVFVDKPDQDALKDQYNADNDPSTWVSDYSAEIAIQLGVLDGLDAQNNLGGNAPVSGCGNQFLYDTENTSYAPLAAALAADVLVVNTSQSTCEQYLGVEAGLADDCGGRTPLMDVVDVSYSVLAAGILAGVGDGVPPTGTANITTFPFLGEPLSQ